MTDGPTVRDELYAFLAENFLYLWSDAPFRDDQDLLETGVIDSTGVVELVMEIEERYGLKVADAEVTEVNFGSLDRLVRFVERKRES